MRNLLLCMCLVVVGCISDARVEAPRAAVKVEARAEYPRLPEGVEGFIRAGHASIWSKYGDTWMEGTREVTNPFVHEGDKVMVLEDDGPQSKPDRRILVKMLSGEYEGRSYLIERDRVSIRPR